MPKRLPSAYAAQIAAHTESTGHAVPVYQRIDQAGYKLPLDERVLADTDTLLVWGLDSMGTEQEAILQQLRLNQA